MNDLIKEPNTIVEGYDFKAVEGLHFNMSDNEYFKIPALSASGLKTLQVNPSRFWWQSWMNPDKTENETEAKILGRAFHRRILEGKYAFNKDYACDFSSDRDDLIVTSDDIKSELQKEKSKYPDIKTTFKSKKDGVEYLKSLDPKYKHTASGMTIDEIKTICLEEKNKYPDIKTTFKSKQEGIDYLCNLDKSYCERIFDKLKTEYETTHAKKIFLSNWAMTRIEKCARVIEYHPHLKTAFIGGYSEVTCVWYDKELKVWCKCRYDYLKTSAINDLKTFTRMGGKEIEPYLIDQIIKYLYSIQASFYMHSMPYAKGFAKAGRVHGCDGIDQEWLDAFAVRPCEQFHFVFQQKEEVPNAYEIIYSQHHSMHDTSLVKIQIAVDNYHRYVATFGDEMWVEINKPYVLTEADFPPWAY